MKSDEELKETYHVTLGADGIMRAVFLLQIPNPEEDARRAELFNHDVVEIINGVSGGGKINAIVDVRSLGSAKVVPPGKAGKIFSETAKHPRLGKIAIVGISPVYKALVKFILIAANKGGEINAFKDEEGAVDWLNKSA